MGRWSRGRFRRDKMGFAAGVLIAALSLLLALPAQVPLAPRSALAQGVAGAQGATGAVEIEVFTRTGCPRCEAAKAFLEELARERPEVRVRYRAVDRDPEALAALRDATRAAKIPAPGVPTFVIRGHVLVGYQDAITERRVRALLDAREEPTEQEAGGVCAPEAQAPCEEVEAEGSVETSFGRISVTKLGMPLFTLVLGLLDGFNPCAMWVLLFLLSMLINLRDRKKMALIAGTFVVASGLVYFAFMAAWLNVFLIIGLSRAVQIVLGLVALAVGFVNVKDFFAFKRGVSLSIPEGVKPSIYARVRAVLRAEHLLASLAGVVVLAVLVNFVELLCTAGFPAVYTAILTKQGLPWWAYYGYLGLYNVAYMADDTLMVTIAVITLGRRKLTERGGRWLKLVSGVVMVALAAALLFRPDLLV